MPSGDGLTRQITALGVSQDFEKVPQFDRERKRCRSSALMNEDAEVISIRISRGFERQRPPLRFFCQTAGQSTARHNFLERASCQPSLPVISFEPMQKWIPIAGSLLLAVVVVGLILRQERAPEFVAADALESVRVDEVDFATRWRVDPETAARAVARGAVLLDARPLRLPAWLPRRHRALAGAIAVDWRDYSDRSARQLRGRLHPDDRVLAAKLQALGIDRQRPVVVAGSPLQGWGEDGRLVWMLRTLGHERAVLVDGGYRALARAAVADGKPKPVLQPGHFVPQRSQQWTIEKEELQKLLKEGKTVILDARSPAEYAGATPHGETRGGRLPGARSLHFRTLVGSDGYLLPPSQIEARLQAIGIAPTDRIVTYCTGGIRSAWLTAILVDLGYDARNYAGSMWEWSAGEPDDFPLTNAGVVP